MVEINLCTKYLFPVFTMENDIAGKKIYSHLSYALYNEDGEIVDEINFLILSPNNRFNSNQKTLTYICPDLDLLTYDDKFVYLYKDKPVILQDNKFILNSKYVDVINDEKYKNLLTRKA